jgi:hypothetical protein
MRGCHSRSARCFPIKHLAQTIVTPTISDKCGLWG